MGFFALLIVVAVSEVTPFKPAPTQIIAGAAVDVSGKPIAGAGVVWILGRNSGPTVHDTVSGTTDREGKFRLESTPGYVGKMLSSDTGACWIHHPEHGAALFNAEDAEIAPGEDSFFLCTVTPSTGKSRVRVVDSKDRLLPGQLIEVVEVDGPQGHNTVPLRVREALGTITGDNGVASLPLKGSNWSATEFGIVSENHGRQVFDLRAREADDGTRTLKLAEVGPLAGRLIRNDGGPLEGIDILAQLDPEAERSALIAALTLSNGKPDHWPLIRAKAGVEYALTTEDGSFAFGQLPLQRFKLVASTTHPSDFLAVSVASVLIEKAELKSVTLTATPTVKVQGHFTQIGDGPTISGLVIFMLHEESGQTFSTIPDATGRYTIGLPPGTIRAVARGMESITQNQVDLTIWKEPVKLAAGDVGRELPPLTLARNGLRTGRILNQDGTPLRRKRVIATEHSVVRGACRSEDDGRIWFSEQVFDTEHNFDVRIEGRYHAANLVSKSPLELKVE